MKRLLWAAAEVCALYGLLGWLYIAAVAAFWPNTLAARLGAGIPLRRDTFGACCFVLAVVGSFAVQVSPPASGRCTRRTASLDAALRTVWFYALLVWAYLCVNSLTHPWTIDRPLTHFAGVPSEGATAGGSFAVSAVALFVLRIRARRNGTGTSRG